MTKKTLHPWAKYRLSSGFTQAEIAEFLGTTRHYVIRLEQSLYWKPSNSLLVQLADKYGIEVGIFEESYYSFVRERRDLFRVTHKSFSEVLNCFPNDGEYGSPLHPLVFYRNTYELSRMGLCKALCLHYEPISEYEVNKQRGIPDQLKEACEEMGWKYQIIEDAVADWRKNGYADRRAKA